MNLFAKQFLQFELILINFLKFAIYVAHTVGGVLARSARRVLIL